jgi:hypothetical protein
MLTGGLSDPLDRFIVNRAPTDFGCIKWVFSRSNIPERTHVRPPVEQPLPSQGGAAQSSAKTNGQGNESAGCLTSISVYKYERILWEPTDRRSFFGRQGIRRLILVANSEDSSLR